MGYGDDIETQNGNLVHEAAINEVRSGEEKRVEKTSGCPRQLIDLIAPIDRVKM